MDQETTASCWLNGPVGIEQVKEDERKQRRIIVDMIMKIAERHGARIDWENTDIESRVIAFDCPEGSESELAQELADLDSILCASDAL